MKWDHAAERQLLELVENAAPASVHFYVAPDRRNYLWSAGTVGDRSSDALLNVPGPDVQYYIRKLHSAGLVDASFMANGDITYISLPLAGHDRLAKLREQTIVARSRRALAGGVQAIVLSVLLPVITSVVTVYVMRVLTE